MTSSRAADVIAPESAGAARADESITLRDLRWSAARVHVPPFCAASGSGGSTRDAVQIWVIGLAVVAAQSWGVSMNNGNCRVVLAWCSPRVGYSATSFGHSSARAAPASSSARTVNVWAPTSMVVLGLALRL